MSRNTCQEVNCSVLATYNYNTEKRAKYCASHKKVEMIDVISRRCKEDGCYTQPSYNYKGETKALYCLKHKQKDMIDVKNKRCIEEDCNKQSTYNYIHEKRAAYCVSHKKDGMVNIKSICCIVDGCRTRPAFNYENENKPLYCAKHKMQDMVMVIKFNKCIQDTCTTIASFNYINETKPIYCATHKQSDMVNITHTLCIQDNCNTRPSYNYDNSKMAIYCKVHKLDGMIDVAHKSCKTPLCDTIISNHAYEGFCMHCFVHLFPDKPNARNYKTKERSVVEFIQSQFQDKTIVSDKRIQDGCSRRRPDILIDLGYQVIMVEVDENQHADYDCSCENKRIMELSKDVGHRPIIFIRFNPDDYINKDNSNVTSCWGIDKRGLCCVKKSKIKEWADRLQVLKDMVSYWIEHECNKTVEVVQLFYDQNIIID